VKYGKGKLPLAVPYILFVLFPLSATFRYPCTAFFNLASNPLDSFFLPRCSCQHLLSASHSFSTFPPPLLPLSAYFTFLLPSLSERSFPLLPGVTLTTSPQVYFCFFIYRLSTPPSSIASSFPPAFYLGTVLPPPLHQATWPDPNPFIVLSSKSPPPPSPPSAILALRHSPSNLMCGRLCVPFVLSPPSQLRGELPLRLFVDFGLLICIDGFLFLVLRYCKNFFLLLVVIKSPITPVAMCCILTFLLSLRDLHFLFLRKTEYTPQRTVPRKAPHERLFSFDQTRF